MPVTLTPYEVTAILGMRSLHLSEGAPALVQVPPNALADDSLYIAALELQQGVLDLQIARPMGGIVHVREARLPDSLDTLLASLTGG